MTSGVLRELVTSGSVAVGSAVMEFDTPGIGHILAAAGCDFVFLDTEHSGWGVETVKRTLRYFEAAGLPTIVRPPSKSPHHITRILDAGADGLLVPMVETADEATEILQHMKYPTAGRRGLAHGIAHDRYSPGPIADKIEEANANTVCIPLIESPRGVENAAEIAAIDGVDMLWIGHSDLAARLGIPGCFDHPDYLAAVDAVVDAARRHGKPLAKLIASVEEGASLHQRGFTFLCYGTDIRLLRQALADGITNLRAECT